jgi:hypothetical protein
VELDGPRADEQLAGDLAVGHPLRDECCDLQLLRGQRGGVGGVVAAARGFPGGAQFLTCPLGPRPGADVVEDGKGGAQVRAGVDPATGATQVLAVGEPGASRIDATQRACVVRERGLEVRSGEVVRREQRVAVGGDGCGPGRSGAIGERGQVVDP